MSTATQTLSIRVGLEGLAGVTAGLNKIRADGVRAAKGIEGTFGNLKSITAGIGGFVAAVAGSTVIHQLIESVNRMDEMAKAASKLGDTAENISSLAYAARLNDVEMSSLQDSLRNLNEFYQKTGQSAGTMREELLQQAEFFATLADGPAKAALAVERFGRSGLEMIPLLNQGREGIMALEQEARRLGITVSDSAAASAESLNDSLTKLKATAEGMTNKFATGLAPAIEKMANGFSYVVGALSANGTFEFVGEAMSKLVDIWAKFDRGPLVALGSGLTEFYGQLAGGRNIADAFRDAIQAAKKSYTDFVDAFTKSQAVVAKTEAKVKAFVAALGDLERMEKLFAQYTETQIGATNRDPGLTLLEKRARLLELNERALESLARREKMLQDRAPKDGTQEDAEGRLRYSEEILKFEEESLRLAKERADLLNRQKELKSDPNSFGDQFGAKLIDMQDKFRTVAQGMADTFENAFNAAQTGISAGIEGLIMQTKTWGEALSNIGLSVVQSIVKSISDMAAQWLMQHIVMKGVSMAWAAFTASMRAKDVVQANATEAAKMPALAANATLASIGSWGVAVAIGLGAIAAIIAGMGGFQSGGYTGDGAPNAMAGVVHKGEYVFDAPSTQRIGVDRLESMRSGQLAPLNPPQGTGGARARDGATIHIANYDNRRDAEKYLESQEGQKFIVSVADNRAIRWR